MDTSSLIRSLANGEPEQHREPRANDHLIQVPQNKVSTGHEKGETDQNEESGSGNESISFFATKRVVLGIMDVALLTANASQLRELLELPYHPHKCETLGLLVLSIVLQLLATAIFTGAYWWNSKVTEGRTYLPVHHQRFWNRFVSFLTLVGTISVVVIMSANIFIAVFLPTGGRSQVSADGAVQKCF